MGIKISELTSVTDLTGSEELPIVQAGSTKKTKIESITAAEDITSQVTLTPSSGITVTDFKAYKVGGIVIFNFSCTYSSTSNHTFTIGSISGIALTSVSGYGRTYGSPASTTVVPASFSLSGNSSNLSLYTSTTSQGALGTIIMPYIPATQTRSANLTMNTGSLIGSGEKSNLLLEEISGDTKEIEPMETKALTNEENESGEMR